MDPAHRYCSRCGSPLGNHPTGAADEVLYEERRTVSVLFADIVGFTALAARLDPEDVHATQREYFEAVRGVLGRCGGVVEKYVGDAVMAVFGAARSDEYDAYRAVRAGLAVQEVLRGRVCPDGTPLRVRVGVATGEAVVDLTAAHDRGQALISGDVVNTAARIQTHAGAGTVLVTAATHEATAGLVHYAALPAVSVAGKPAPLEVWQAREIRPWPAAPAPGTDRIPVVGRASELAAAVDCLARGRAARAPRLISIVGPAGIGKSRFIRELAQGSEGVAWWIGRGVPGATQPYEALANLVRTHAGILGDDDREMIRRRLAAAFGNLVGAGEWSRTLDALEVLLGSAARSAPLLAPAASPDAVRLAALPDAVRQAALTWRRLLLAAALHEPIVLVLEDLQWVDPATTRFVRELLTAAGRLSLPLSVVTASRGDPIDPASLSAGVPARLSAGLSVGDSELTIVLCPLDAADTTRLLGRLLCHAGLAAAPDRRLVTLAGGNPRYAYEYVRVVARSGTRAGHVIDPPIPAPVRRLVSALLDELDDFDRAVLHAAAALADSVYPDAVAALLDAEPVQVVEALRRLERRQLLQRWAGSTVDGTEVYAFAHIVQEVAYARLPRATRARYHRGVLEWMDRQSSVLLPAVPAGHDLGDDPPDRATMTVLWRMNSSGNAGNEIIRPGTGSGRHTGRRAGSDRRPNGRMATMAPHPAQLLPAS